MVEKNDRAVEEVRLSLDHDLEFLTQQARGIEKKKWPWETLKGAIYRVAEVNYKFYHCYEFHTIPMGV